ncbi:hypothetical protein [Streptomyces sp. NRRL S-1813]|uniref:hypothetical protein n=1 Tax=Streptomyces sp. NRRL S-1813 TaxID=1463888 RepID=UPI003B6334AE
MEGITGLVDAGDVRPGGRDYGRGRQMIQRAHRESADHLARIPGRDWKWGTATARQRLVHRLGAVFGRPTPPRSPTPRRRS